MLLARKLKHSGYAELRLAVVSPFVDRRHGTERALAELLERLARDYDCEIHLYSQSVRDLLLSEPSSASTTESGAIIWHRVPAVPGPQLVQFLAWMFFNGLLRKWHALLGRGSYDLLFSPGINCLRPDVVIVHALFHRLNELSRQDNEDPNARPVFFRRIHRKAYYGLLAALEKRIYTDPRIAVASVSKHTANLLAQYFQRENVSIIANGVDATHFSLTARLSRRSEARQRRNFNDNDFVLLLIGNDWRNKGLPALLEALAALSNLPLRLLIVGDDSTEPFLKRAVQLGVEKRCLWERSGPDVLDFYAAADVYVSPSREDSFGLPVAEAMACGLPVITSASAGVADCVRDGLDGFVLSEPRDSARLAQLIGKLQREPELRRNLGEAAAKTILEWDWNRNAAAVWGLLSHARKKSHANP